MQNAFAPSFPLFFPYWRLERRNAFADWLDRQRQRSHLARLDLRLLNDIGVSPRAAEEESRRWT